MLVSLLELMCDLICPLAVGPGRITSRDIIGHFLDGGGWSRPALALQFGRFRGLGQPRWCRTLGRHASYLPLSSCLVAVLHCSALMPAIQTLSVQRPSVTWWVFLCGRGVARLQDACSLSSFEVVQNCQYLQEIFTFFLLRQNLERCICL